MLQTIKPPANLAAVIALIEEADLPYVKRRDMLSAINRLCVMAGVNPAAAVTDVPALRRMLAGIRPARHDVSPKTFANQKSLFRDALEMAGVIEPMGRGCALRHPDWGPLMQAVKSDKRMANGLAAFANYCVRMGIPPDVVDDRTVRACLAWLEAKTLCPRPRDVIRRVPVLWNEARERAAAWPRRELTRISFRTPSPNCSWEELGEAFRGDADAYLELRRNPDLFDERPNAPRRPLGKKTLRLQRDHLRLAASVLVRHGTPVEEITSLADLVGAEAFKTVLRHYHEQGNSEPNSFAVSIANTLLAVARYHVGLTPEEIDRLKALAAKLPAIPFDLTAKNKALLRDFESGRLRAKLVFLPGTLQEQVDTALAETGRLRFVDAQVAVAVALQLAAPLRPQNLASLNGRRHIQEPDGPRGRILLHIPAAETKTGKRELVFELTHETARLLRWYRREVLPRLGAAADGDLFVKQSADRKSQETLSQQITETIERRVGIHMTPHQFRHVAAVLYLEAHPEDFATVQALLGHSSARTTLIYAGSSTLRAGRAYATFVGEQREALKLRRLRRKTKKKEKGKEDKKDS